MAGLVIHADSGEVALVAATSKTVIQLTAPTNQRLLIRSVRVYSKGTNPLGNPLRIEVLRQTSAGVMTAVTLQRDDPNSVEIIQASAAANASTEPAAGGILHTREIHPQAGLELFYPRGQELQVQGGGRIGIRCTADQAFNVAAGLTYEE